MDYVLPTLVLVDQARFVLRHGQTYIQTQRRNPRHYSRQGYSRRRVSNEMFRAEVQFWCPVSAPVQ